jgi:hypothetical protein
LPIGKDGRLRYETSLPVPMLCNPDASARR